MMLEPFILAGLLYLDGSRSSTPFALAQRAPLFAQTAPGEAVEMALRAAAARRPGLERPRLECGMLVVPADTRIDPKMAREIPRDADRFTLRVVPPPSCAR